MNCFPQNSQMNVKVKLLLLLLVFRGIDTEENVVNKIVMENRLPGSPSTEWDVNGAGSDDIQGFTTKISYLPGDIVKLKVYATEKEESFDVSVYRFGWYNGAGARLVLKKEKNTIISQPKCSNENNVVDCGNWAVATEFKLPNNATSGLYAARLELQDNGENWREDGSKLKWDPHHHMEGRDYNLPPEQGLHSYGSLQKFKLRNALKKPRASLAFFIVRSNQKHDLLFQTADTTWHAYNGWGGLSTYGSFEFPWTHAPEHRYMQENEILYRAYKRSYNTPLITRDYRAVNAPLGAEYAAIRFLERLGIDLHYTSGADLGSPPRAQFLLKNSKAYLSVGHDEYFSYEQRAALEKARHEAGLHLFFWSGNEAYWAIRFEHSNFTSEHSQDPPRTLVCYKETQSAVKLDPLPNSWTGTFRDARSINPRGPLPENALTGTMFATNAQRNDPLVIEPRRFGGHRLWANTAVRASFLEKKNESIVYLAGILGHEWDEPIDNGIQPAYLQKLSATTIDTVQAIIDWGSVFDTATATHSFVLFRDNDAITFGAGTVQYSWALDDTHDMNDPQRANKYSTRVMKDARGSVKDLQQFTVNLFAEANIKMPLLESNFVQEQLVLPTPSTDTLPPAAVLDTAHISSDGVLWASGRAFDLGGGVVSSVEIAWPESDLPLRWFSAQLDALDTAVTWTFSWNDQPWHAWHGNIPKRNPAFNATIRVSDDSGNHATFSNVNAVVPTTAIGDEL